MKISMKTDDVISLLHEHAESHGLEFIKQMSGWKQEMEHYSQDMVRWANSGRGHDTRPQEPPKPVKYTKEYAKLIKMVEHHIGEYIQLDDDDFRHVVEDDFGWKSHFLANSARYSTI